MENCILYDWLSFSLPTYSCEQVITLLGLDSMPVVKGLGSRYRYGERWQLGKGISIHWTAPHDFRYNPGVFVELSGTGCREFETYGSMSFDILIEVLKHEQANVSRIDIAYDDFTGKIDIQEMARAAKNFEYVSQFKARSIFSECADSDPEHEGLTVCHGVRGSRTFFRCYDKRVERGAFEEFEHWIRFEIQLRSECAMGFINFPGNAGDKFRGVVSRYLQYVVPSVTDQNKSRWPVCQWWSEFLEDVASIRVYSKKDVEYNRARLESYVYSQCRNAVRTALRLDGLDCFLDKTCGNGDLSDLPVKYAHLIEQQESMLERIKQYEEETHKKVSVIVHDAVEQGRRDQILKTICGST